MGERKNDRKQDKNDMTDKGERELRMDKKNDTHE